jgi:hypothetical protein
MYLSITTFVYPGLKVTYPDFVKKISFEIPVPALLFFRNKVKIEGFTPGDDIVAVCQEN